jgi:hypothetical protein
MDEGPLAPEGMRKNEFSGFQVEISVEDDVDIESPRAVSHSALALCIVLNPLDDCKEVIRTDLHTPPNQKIQVGPLRNRAPGLRLYGPRDSVKMHEPGSAEARDPHREVGATVPQIRAERED